MRLEQLDYLLGVSRAGTFRRASQVLHVSVPALSEAISALERELGVALLDRHRSGTRISGDGTMLIGSIVEVLGAVDRLRRSAEALKRPGRQVTIAVSDRSAAIRLAPALLSFEKANPDLGYTIRTMQFADLEASLLAGTVDLALTTVVAGDVAHPDLVSSRLRTGRVMVALPDGHRHAGATSITPESVRAEPFIDMRAGHVLHRVARHVFGHDLTSHRHEVDDPAIAACMVGAGLGWALSTDVTGTYVERTSGLGVRRVALDPEPPGLSIEALHLRGVAGTGWIERLIEQIADAFRA